MANAEISRVVPVSKKRLFEVITRYEDYPDFVDGVNKVEVERKATGRARVTYHVKVMKDITYTIDLQEDFDNGVIEWSLVESEFFNKNNGRWDIKEVGENQSEVTYALDLDFKIPVPGFIVKKLVKGSLPTMVSNFEKRARG